MHEKVHSIAKHEGMPKVLKKKTETKQFILTRIGLQELIITEIMKTKGEEDEEDSDYEPDSESDNESEGINYENDDEEDSHVDLQEASNESESDSNDKWANETFVEIPEFKVKKPYKTEFEDLESESNSDKENDEQLQPKDQKREIETPSSRRRRFIFASKVERSIRIDTSIEEAKDEDDSVEEMLP